MTGILSIHYTMHAFLMVIFIDFPILQIRTTDAFSPRIHILQPPTKLLEYYATPHQSIGVVLRQHTKSFSRYFFNSGAYFSPEHIEPEPEKQGLSV